MYKIYTEVNYADTSRDPDNIHIKELGYRKKEEDALNLANDYIKENFFRKNTKLIKHKKGWSATDFCSYGATIYIEKIEVL